MDETTFRARLRAWIGSDLDDPGFVPEQSLGGASASPSGAGSSRFPGNGSGEATPLLSLPGFSGVREIGRGGMGVVYEARQESLGRIVALKRVKKSRLEDAHTRRAFLAEALAAGGLDHPNILPIHDLVVAPSGELVIVMKKIEGRSWHDLLHPGEGAQPPLPLERHLEILLVVSEAVAYAHNRGILHRDLKPSNILLGDFGEIYVTDWGMACRIEAKGPGPDIATVADAGPPCGTLAYMAPEQVLPKGKKLGPWTDVYLLGGILYEVLTGRRPHEGATGYEVARAAAEGHFRPLGEEIPAGLRTIVDKALAPSVVDRFARAEDFKAALAEYLRHRESLRLEDEGRAALARGRALLPDDARPAARDTKRGYSEFADAVAAFKQALVLWSGNAAARDGEIAARLAHAEFASRAGDFGLVDVLLEGVSGSDADERRRAARSAAAAREKTERTAQRLRRSLAVVGSLVILVLGAAVVLVSREKSRTDEQARRAEENATRATANEALAKENAEKAAAGEREAKALLARVEVETKGRLQALEEKEAEARRAAATAEEARREAERAAALAREAAEANRKAAEKTAEAARSERKAGEAERRAEESAIESEAATAAKEEAEGEARRLADLEALHRLETGGTALLAAKTLDLAAKDGFLVDARALAGRLEAHADALDRARLRHAETLPPALRKDLETLRRQDYEVAARLLAATNDADARNESARAELDLVRKRREPLAKKIDAALLRDLPADDARRRYEFLVRGLADMEEFFGLTDGLFARVDALEKPSAPSDAKLWEKAIAEIREHPRYGGLRLEPLPGLLPLGRDPKSRLVEFLHIGSHDGPVPARGKSGDLEVGETTGIVFVLLPSGEAVLGAQSEKPNDTHYDPGAAKDEAPVRRARLQAFLIAKHETTQAQWQRLTGKSPSGYGPKTELGGRLHSLRHPVETINVADLRAVQDGRLDLPTEAEWEYAARAGTKVPWIASSEVSGLAPLANIADLAAKRADAKRSNEAWDDGWAAHAPVGSFLPNAFGLHDVLGNVAEWCKADDSPSDPRAGSALRTLRGGSWNSLSKDARVSARALVSESRRHASAGLRFVYRR